MLNNSPAFLLICQHKTDTVSNTLYHAGALCQSAPQLTAINQHLSFTPRVLQLACMHLIVIAQQGQQFSVSATKMHGRGILVHNHNHNQ